MPTPWTCTRCGDCCRTTPYVVVSDDERAVLEQAGRDVRASWLPDEAPGFWRLLAAPCPFYKDGCTVYAQRPLNCRRYASLKGYTGSERDGQRVRVIMQRRAHASWGHKHGWVHDATAS